VILLNAAVYLYVLPQPVCVYYESLSLSLSLSPVCVCHVSLVLPFTCTYCHSLYVCIM